MSTVLVETNLDSIWESSKSMGHVQILTKTLLLSSLSILYITCVRLPLEHNLREADNAFGLDGIAISIGNNKQVIIITERKKIFSTLQFNILNFDYRFFVLFMTLNL